MGGTKYKHFYGNQSEQFTFYKGNEALMIGEYRGFKMELSFDSFKQEYELTLKGKMSHRFSLGTDARGNITRMDNALAGISNRLEKARTQIDNLYHQEEAAKLEVGKPFPQEAELSQKSARLAELDAALNMDDNHSSEEISEEKPSVIAELKKHSSTIVPEKNRSNDEVCL